MDGRSTNQSLRHRILAFVGALVLLSLAGSTISLFRITEVNTLLDGINRTSVPLGRLFSQMLSDAEVLKREFERNLGASHWQSSASGMRAAPTSAADDETYASALNTPNTYNPSAKDAHWRPRPIPRWIEDLLRNELARSEELMMRADSGWTAISPADVRARWEQWFATVQKGFDSTSEEAARLYSALDQGDEVSANRIYPTWTADLEDLQRQLQWGANEYDRQLRQAFSLTESRVSELRTGLETILAVVVMLSLLFLWLGERALRPLAELTSMAREITRRGLRREDKFALPEMPLSRADEVSQLAREFHHMATALLEREKMVEAQKRRLQEQNRMLRDMGELNQSVLNSIDSVLIVTDLDDRITQCNPVACRWLDAEPATLIGSELKAWPKVSTLIAPSTGRRKLEPCKIDGRVYGGELIPLVSEGRRGSILVVNDLTDDLDLQERLRIAENLAAVGRMSAQVAHEVRNPLHSIGLEAEMAAEMAAKLGHSPLKQALQSILSSVDRLGKITANYLKLSRLSAGEKREVDLSQVLESVLATYAPTCESLGVTVDWKREGQGAFRVWGDGDLLEQALGNLFRNALQAIESIPNSSATVPRVDWRLGHAESGKIWLRIEDNGPGVPAEIRERLFTPFVTTRAQGTGLGLSFIKRVLDDHLGEIHYVDRPEGGACFEVLLPDMECEAPNASEGSELLPEALSEVLPEVFKDQPRPDRSPSPEIST